MKKILFAALALCSFCGQAQAASSNNPFAEYAPYSYVNNPRVSSDVSKWPPDILKSYLWISDRLADQAYYGELGQDGPGEIVLLDGNELPSGQISFERLADKTKKEQNAVWVSYKTKLMESGYHSYDVREFSTSPVKFGNFDSRLLDPDEQAEVYEIRFKKFLGTKTITYGGSQIRTLYSAGQGQIQRVYSVYAYVTISRRPELRDGKLNYPLISSYYTDRERY